MDFLSHFISKNLIFSGVRSRILEYFPSHAGFVIAFCITHIITHFIRLARFSGVDYWLTAESCCHSDYSFIANAAAAGNSLKSGVEGSTCFYCLDKNSETAQQDIGNVTEHCNHVLCKLVKICMKVNQWPTELARTKYEFWNRYRYVQGAVSSSFSTWFLPLLDPLLMWQIQGLRKHEIYAHGRLNPVCIYQGL